MVMVAGSCDIKPSRVMRYKPLLDQTIGQSRRHPWRGASTFWRLIRRTS